MLSPFTKALLSQNCLCAWAKGPLPAGATYKIRVMLRVEKGLRFGRKLGFQWVNQKGQTLIGRAECILIKSVVFKLLPGERTDRGK